MCVTLLRSCGLCLHSPVHYTWYTCQFPRTSREILVFDENYVSFWHAVLSEAWRTSGVAWGWCTTPFYCESRNCSPNVQFYTFSSLPAVYIRREEVRHHLRLHCPQMIGVKESSESGSVRWSTVKGRVFILLPAFASHIIVARDSMAVRRKLTM